MAVVTENELDQAEKLPAASRARTVIEYEVFAVRPVTTLFGDPPVNPSDVPFSATS
jgi:hypothetical protein